MFRWPAKVKPADRPELCSSIDIVPTILAAAGAEIPQQLPGLNLLANLQDGTPISRNAIFGESFAHDIADIENPQASLLYRWVIRDHSKLLLTYDGQPGKMKYPPVGGQPQLFDLKADPHEHVNLAAKQPDVVKELRELLTNWYPVTERKEGVVAAATRASDKRTRRAKASEQRAAAAADVEPAVGLAATKDGSAGPNILLLFADDQRNHTLGCAGHPIVKTPNIDRLAAEGVRFENAFVSTSTCWVSRACLFTGCYERRHLYRVKPGPLDPELCETSYFAVLKKAGYRTGHIGKEHVAIAEESAAAMFDVRRKLGRNPYFKKQPDGSERHETQILGDWGIEFLQRTTEGPTVLSDGQLQRHSRRGRRQATGYRSLPVAEGDGWSL